MSSFLTILLLMAAFAEPISGACRHSFMTLCDTLEDFKRHNDPQNLEEVIIGSHSEKHNKMTSVNFMESFKLDKYKLSSLIIIGSINHLEKTYHYECLYITSSLKYLSLYGNDLKRVEKYHFPLMPLEKFSLVNNKIESLGPEAFMHQSVKILDLSDNFLETLEEKSLPTTLVTKVLIIKNNKLSHIPPKSFPKSLECLNLDRNNLRFMEDEVLKGLNELKQLTMSHNKFREIPEIVNLTKLVVFDMSFNQIVSIPYQAFKNMINLKLVDLSHNKIYSPFILNWINVPHHQPYLTVSLAFNRLKELSFKKVDLQNQSLILYGNPWDCSKWNDLKMHIIGHESKCDLEYLADQETPFCISYGQESYNFTGMWETDADAYQNSVKKHEELSNCELTIKKHHMVHPVDFFCVFVKH